MAEEADEEVLEEDYGDFADELLVNDDGEYEEDVECRNPQAVYIEDAWTEDD